MAHEIIRLNLVPPNEKTDNIGSFTRKVIFTLDEHNKLIIYQHPRTMEDKPPAAGISLLEQVCDEIARLQVTGKIDMTTDLKVTFVGDKRVLEDIKLLAENGYGEDKFGNNIPLPERLSYLRR